MLLIRLRANDEVECVEEMAGSPVQSCMCVCMSVLTGETDGDVC